MPTSGGFSELPWMIPVVIVAPFDKNQLVLCIQKFGVYRESSLLCKLSNTGKNREIARKTGKGLS